MVTDSVEVLAAAQEEHLSYKLRHYRIGHMSDRGLIELNKKGLILALQKKENELCESYIYGK